MKLPAKSSIDEAKRQNHMLEAVLTGSVGPSEYKIIEYPPSPLSSVM